MLLATPTLDHANDLIIVFKTPEYFLNIAKLGLIRVYLKFDYGLNYLINSL